MSDEESVEESVAYVVLKRKRNAQLSLVTKTANNIRGFKKDDSPHLLTAARKAIEEAKASFNNITEVMQEHREAVDDEIEATMDKFQTAFITASSLIDDELEKIRQAECFNNVLKMRDELGALKFAFNEFKCFSEEVEAPDPNEVSLRLKELEKLKTQHDELFKDLFAKEGADAKAKMQQDRKEFSAEYYKVLVWFSMNGAAKPPREASNSAAATSMVKLPKIELPKFCGSPDTWVNFRDTYLSLIHNITTLSDALKFRYLKSAITDKNSPIAHLQETESGYESAWKAVLDYYDDKRRILDCHLSSMLKVKPMEHESHEELQRVLNDYTLHVSAIERMHSEKELYQAMVAHLVLRRLDTHTRDLWETENKGKTPFWPSLQIFLKDRRKTLSTMPAPKFSQQKTTSKPSAQPARSTNSHASSATETAAGTNGEKSDRSKCHMCENDHRLHTCAQFANLTVPQRSAKVKEWKICFNCFGFHSVRACTSKHRCRTCKQRHHSLLHSVTPAVVSNPATASPPKSSLQATAEPFTPIATSNSAAAGNGRRITLFQTAMVPVMDGNGKWQHVRAFLDSGSDANFISTSAAKALNLSLEKTHVEAKGIGGSKAMTIRQQTIANVKVDDSSLPISFLVSVKITNPMPSKLLTAKIDLPPNVQLADPNFHTPGKIDMLIGNEFYGELIREGRVKLDCGVTLLNSSFGFVLSGSVPEVSPISQTLTVRSHHSALADLRTAVEKFYCLEDYRSPKKFLTAEETYCEQIFEQTHQRSPTGRFIVTIPYKPNLALLKNNFQNALSQFLASEKRWQRNESLRSRVVAFMREYESLGHMTEVDTIGESPDTPAFYMPYHAIEKPDSTTTKLRVVFNGSARTPSGLSLNDTQCVGPQVQSDVFSLSLRFRTYDVVIKADLEKMYRQIEIADHQRRFQRIIFRESPDEKLKVYELNTVTYGTSAASYQATKCLQELGFLFQYIFPKPAHDIIHCTYMDDVIAGAKTSDEAKLSTGQMMKIFDSARMKLRKFSSNDAEYLSSIPDELRDTVSEDSTIKALGIKWNPGEDFISFESRSVRHENVTRRIILSEIASNYDIVGLLGPVTFSFKKFLKLVFGLSLPWDAPVPPREAEEWSRIASTFEDIGLVKIPRKITIDDFTDVQLHGFCDASDAGYGACIYVVSQNAEGEKLSRLLCAKSRIAPKEYRSTARLELCGAVILANVMDQVSKCLSLPITKKFAWTDSAIVLYWLQKCPSQLLPFVANRVSEVQELSTELKWLHVRGTANPADLISRGLTPAELLECSLWWNGPDFLLLPEEQWPESIVTVDPNEPIITQELKKFEAFAHTISSDDINPLVALTERCSRFFTVKWKAARALRFVRNCRAKSLNLPTRSGPINVDDLLEAEFAIVRAWQIQEYPSEYKKLSEGSSVPRSSKLKNLDPMFDVKLKLMRVGGRLDRAEELDEEQKHPIILPNGHLARLVIRDTHEKNLHAGINATHSYVRLRYWPVRTRGAVRFEVHRCVKCFRHRPKLIQQKMGQLPPKRVTPSSPFQHTGVDFAGPFDIKSSKLRSAKMIKSYVCLFVCMSTKAIHMEIVTDLSTDAFLAAFDKFVSRRGLPTSMTSDHGLNFVGARNKLADLLKFLKLQTTQQEIHDYLAKQEIRWNFIPPRAPSQGGLWEAAVKSMKQHFYRVAANASLTFEEFDRLKSKIEAILNSRPLTAVSDDPSDFAALTAGHFLIGRPLIAKPDHDLTDRPITHLQRWDRVLQLQQHFWKRWNREYLHQLQTRTKNYKDVIPVSAGQLVLLQLENMPSMCWPLARITSIFPGDDGVTRIAKLRTGSSTFERPVNKLAMLPIDLEGDSTEAGEDVRA